eukprot:TRINITY_DN95864_c0_g1_i1.p1 TRINITY_DN95864_c0_g1~~TRINITY_DN95864_c0_g1_i1.p1  ORF type:complete len:157 (+),score=41.07 TRINITY_DN95864_c0_g1_i1:176-646(+)
MVLASSALLRTGSPVTCFEEQEPELLHTDMGQNIPEDPTERVAKASAVLDDIRRTIETVATSAHELASAGAVLAEKGDRLSNVGEFIKVAQTQSTEMQKLLSESLKSVQALGNEQKAGVSSLLVALAALHPQARHSSQGSVERTKKQRSVHLSRFL